MHLFKVTIIVKKPWGEWMKMQWLTIADTGEGAIEQVIDDVDFTGIEIISTKAEEKEGPIFINIRENL